LNMIEMEYSLDRGWQGERRVVQSVCRILTLQVKEVTCQSWGPSGGFDWEFFQSDLPLFQRAFVNIRNIYFIERQRMPMSSMMVRNS
jgi:hypothetical protein